MSGGRLTGRVVLVTRPRSQAAELTAALRARGARPVLAPAIRLRAVPARVLDEAIDELRDGRFDWLLLTSRTGVQTLLRRMVDRGLDPSAIPAAIAAVGDGTAAELRSFDVEPALVPSTFTTEALGDAMPRGRGRALLARADIAPEGLEGVLRRKGWAPVRVDVYRTTLASSLPRQADAALRRGDVDAVTFTSASTVRGFSAAAAAAFEDAAKAAAAPAVVCIGPVTAHEARKLGYRVDAIARPHTIEGLVAALERVFAADEADTAEER